MQAQVLAPGAALIVWSLAMLVWMAVRRGTAMRRADLDLGALPPGGRGSDLEGKLEPPAQWTSHNYSHLMEQPTLFYAAILILALTGAGAVDVLLAWAYVFLRIVHSLWQATVNRIPVRLGLFIASTLCLMVLAVRSLLTTLFHDPAAVF